MKTTLLPKLLLLFAFITPAATALAQKITVSDCNLDGWQEFTESTGTISFENGPANPPLGKGSILYELGADRNGKAAIFNTTFSGTPLADLTELSYWTYVEHYLNGQAPALELAIDNDGNGIPDDGLVFEPIYQNGVPFGPIQNGGIVLLNTWQEWDALIGGWWTAHDGTAGPPTTTLDLYLSAHPTAQIIAVVLTTGGGVTWDDFIGNADALKIGVNGKTTTYDFEPCTPCGNKNDKVVVCHNGHDICISENAVQAHLDHGDEIGSCDASAKAMNSKAATEISIPVKFNVSNYPNPFTAVTRIQFQLPFDSKVSLKVYDVTGREISTLVNADKNAGIHNVGFNASGLSKGVYYYKISAIAREQQFIQTQKMVLLK